jgi:phosphatidylglycerophosphatase A
MSTPPSDPREASPGSTRIDLLAVLLATGLGVGQALPAPGTFGSLWGLPLAWLLLQLPGIAAQATVLAVLFAVGVPLCTRAARCLGKKDPGAVVWDELVTVPLVFLGLSSSQFLQPLVLLAGFTLHRFFDILKLPPCRQLERLPAGLGIMADDLAAACYAWLVLRLLLPLLLPAA